MSKLSDELDNDVVKKSVYGELVKKVNSIHAFDTSKLVTKTDSDTKINDIEKKKFYS